MVISSRSYDTEWMAIALGGDGGTDIAVGGIGEDSPSFESWGGGTN